MIDRDWLKISLVACLQGGSTAAKFPLHLRKKMLTPRGRHRSVDAEGQQAGPTGSTYNRCLVCLVSFTKEKRAVGWVDRERAVAGRAEFDLLLGLFRLLLVEHSEML